MGLEQAFTLIELLVVIAIIALLMAILMPALSRAREQGRRVVCAAQAKFTGMGLFMYASENDGRMPENTVVVAEVCWPMEISFFTTEQIIGPTPHGYEDGTKGDKRTFYCPSVKYADSADEDDPVAWQFIPAWGTGPAWRWQDELVMTTQQKMAYTRVTDYFFLLDRGKGGQGGNSFQIRGTPQKGWAYSMSQCHVSTEKDLTPITQPAGFELITDATYSTSENPQDPGNEWRAVNGSGYPSQGFHHYTNHMSGSKPAGANIFFLDGHREWRHFRSGVPETVSYGFDEVLVRGNMEGTPFWW